MQKKLLHMLLISSALWWMSGCGSDEPKPKKKTPPGFHTNKTLFVNVPDKKAPTKEMRNALMDEYIQKSDIQCQQYLNDPIMRATSPNRSKSQLYANMFDNVSELVGTKGITDGAQALYSKKDKKDPYKMQMVYERALSPEIIRGVEIARERYAQKILSNKYRLIESYTIPMLEKDMATYDRLCNYETGLIEINRILQDARKPKNTYTPFAPTLRIDPDTIKNKVEAVTKEAESKENRTVPKNTNNNMRISTASHQNANIWDAVESNTTNQNDAQTKEPKHKMSVGIFPGEENNETVSDPNVIDL